jgi:hypothetical protein
MNTVARAQKRRNSPEFLTAQLRYLAGQIGTLPQAEWPKAYSEMRRIQARRDALLDRQSWRGMRLDDIEKWLRPAPETADPNVRPRLEARSPRRREHRSAAPKTGPPDDDGPASDDDEESSIGGALGQQVGRDRPRLVGIPAPSAITVSDRTSLAVCGMEPLFFRRFVVEHGVPNVKIHRRTIAKVVDVLAAFDRLAGIEAPTTAVSAWSAESVIVAACGGSRGAR